MTGNFSDIIGSLGYTYAKSGQKDAALKELKKLKDLAAEQKTRASEFCMIYTGLGNYDQAFKWLETTIKNHEFSAVIMLGCDSELFLKDLMPDPRFREFLAKIGLKK